MVNICKSLKELSYQGHWDEVFTCLNIDANSTIELAGLKIPEQRPDVWLDNHRATLNSLEVILGFILLCDQIFYILLLAYLFLFLVKFIRVQVYGKTQQCLAKLKIMLKSGGTKYLKKHF